MYEIHAFPKMLSGQISAQRFLLDLKPYEAGASAGAKAGIELLEEAIIRRQLSDNFCFNKDNTDIFGKRVF